MDFNKVSGSKGYTQDMQTHTRLYTYMGVFIYCFELNEHLSKPIVLTKNLTIVVNKELSNYMN